MSYRSFILFSLLAMPCVAGTPVAMKEQALLISVAPYKHIQEEFLNLHRSLAACLSEVHDKESADSAVVTVRGIRDNFHTLKEEEKKLPAPSTAVQKALHKQNQDKEISELNLASTGKILELTLEMPSPCYGSTALASELAKLLAQFGGSF